MIIDMGWIETAGKGLATGGESQNAFSWQPRMVHPFVLNTYDRKRCRTRFRIF